ncbi:uncharacterized protein LOC103575954 [Microplitis demolitor]|uniref:uncharacterized protein LOC103575954 n=1 Tax=Microplitis demolitor TaxID=69319 RepID=UPI0004CDAEC9|nr:uncharacterized protein LOC103575954 [Microplitis demolitor]
MGWSRPPGDPRVWCTVESINADGKKLKFIIQEIPLDRYEEALDHLCTVFITSEAICSSINLANDRDSVAELRAFWKTALDQGITIGAFEADENNKISTLAGLNVLMVEDKDSDKTIVPIMETMSRSEKILNFMHNLSVEVDFCKKWSVDYYLTAAGLDVDPHYRRLGLGTHLLLARDKIGCAYNIPVTSTFFTSPIAQKSAKNAGFKVFLDRRWNDITDEQGNIIFPGLGDTCCKVMEKKLL